MEWHLDQIICDLIEHYHSVPSSAFLYSAPCKLLKHVGDSSGVSTSVVTSDESSRLSLDSLN